MAGVYILDQFGDAQLCRPVARDFWMSGGPWDTVTIIYVGF